MRLFLLLLLIALFIQTTFLTINLVLILLTVRFLLVDESFNYLASFLSGIFLGLLSSTNIGLWAILFLLFAKIIPLVRKIPVSPLILLLPVSVATVGLASLMEKVVLQQNFNLVKISLEIGLCFPIYLVLQFWEERVSPHAALKLKTNSLSSKRF